MRKFYRMLWVAVLTVLAGGTMVVPPAAAHFQLVYTPEAVLHRPGEIVVKLVFSHPFENGHTMNMGQPESFFVAYRGARTDLTPTLKPITWKGAENEGQAFEAVVPVKRNGDYVLVLTPAPYLEESEDIYIQQITKTILNKGGTPTDWSEPVGLPTEIVPLNKPYNVLAGSTFSGVLLSNGKPVPGAEIEIEYIAAPPDMKANAFPPEASVNAPDSALVAVTDASGAFTYGLPRAGWWGFAALGSGPEKTYQGKKLSQDAVIWVYVSKLD